MLNPFDFPLLLLVVFLPGFWLSALCGARFRSRHQVYDEHSQELFRFILGGTLTLLALIVGFTFSMAVSRYDQRKNLEAAEANAIGTAWVRADLLPTDDAGRIRALIGK